LEGLSRTQHVKRARGWKGKVEKKIRKVRLWTEHLKKTQSSKQKHKGKKGERVCGGNERNQKFWSVKGRCRGYHDVLKKTGHGSEKDGREKGYRIQRLV